MLLILRQQIMTQMNESSFSCLVSPLQETQEITRVTADA